MIGQEYGHFKVLEYAGTNKHNKAQWLCRCDCGNEVVVTQQNLINGNSTKCKKCSYVNLRHPRKDLSGQKFGKLTVLEYAGDRTYKCLCDCGNETIVRQTSLKSGNTRSCGCAALGQNGSKQETKMVETIKNIYGNENVLDIKSVGSYRPDCILYYNGQLYDIEYDGYHWHNEEHDRIRDEYFVNNGYKVIRFICIKRTIATSYVKEQDIIDAINYLQNTNNFIYKNILQ